MATNAPQDLDRRLMKLSSNLGTALGIPPASLPQGDPLAQVEERVEDLILSAESRIRREEAVRLDIEHRMQYLLREFEGLANGGSRRSERGQFLDDPAVDRVVERIEDLHRSLEEARDRYADQNQDLERMVRDRERFLAFVSHELKVPLTSVRSYTEILMMELTLTPEQREFLETIIGEADRMAGMIHDLVDLERVREGKFRMEMKPAQMRTCILSALRTVHSLCLENRILIQLDLEEGLPTVMMDGDRIVQVLVNLMSNCIKYSPEGSPITTTARLDGGLLEVSIRDHGPGIPGDRLERIFEIYEGADSRGIRGDLGTGLGLAISKRILEGHGGSIRAELPQDGGTRFVFSLPVQNPVPVLGA